MIELVVPSVIREASVQVVNMLSPAGMAGSRKSGLGWGVVVLDLRA